MPHRSTSGEDHALLTESDNVHLFLCLLASLGPGFSC